MARPVTTRPTVRVQAPQSPNSPGLDVVAPTVVHTPGAETDPLFGLSQILGVTSKIGGDYVKQKREDDRKQGYADAQLGKVDDTKKSKSDTYADGVYHYAVIKQFNDAADAVEEEASNGGLNETMSAQEKVAWYDAKMKEHLADLAKDPHGRQVIADRYGDFLNRVGAREVEQNVANNRKLVVDAAQADISRQIEDKRYDFSASVADMASVVGRADAVGANVAAIAQAAIAKNDKSILDLVPAEVTTEDGQKIAGPRYTPKYREVLRQAADEIDRNTRQQGELDAAKQRLDAFRVAEEAINKGDIITPDFWKVHGISTGDEPGRVLSAAQANSYEQQSIAKRLEKDKKALAFNTALTLKNSAGGRWLDIVNMTGGPENKEKAQDYLDEEVKQTLTAMTGDESLVGGAGIGNAVVEDIKKNGGKGITKIALDYASAQDLPYTPLKLWADNITPSAPGGVMQRLPFYREAKARNVDHLFVSDESAAVYEVASSLQDANASDQEIQDTIRRMGDKSTKEYVQENRTKVAKMIPNLVVDETWINTKVTGLANRPQVEAAVMDLAQIGLSKGASPEQAFDWAKHRFAATHFYAKVGSKELMLPNAIAASPKQAQGALEWWSTEVLPKYPGADADAELRVLPNYRGRDPEFVVVNGEGRDISRRLKLDEMVAMWRKFTGFDARENTNKRNDFLRTPHAYKAPLPGQSITPEPKF